MKILSYAEFVNEECVCTPGSSPSERPVPGYSGAGKIPGGLADGMTLEDLAKKHKVNVDHLKEQLAKGVKVELEHTSDKKLAEEIAMDHLTEDPDYYDKLAGIEEDAGAFASLDSTPGMGEPVLAGPGITGSGDVPGAYNKDDSKSRGNKRKRSKRSLSKEDDRVQFRRMERLL